MTREEAINYLRSSGMSEGQIDDVTDALEAKDVLDKIRAEIDRYLFLNEFGTAYRAEVSQIIDKYRAESEDKE